MASLARLFLWKPSCHGNTPCLFELEMSSSIPSSLLLRGSRLHFGFPVLRSWLPLTLTGQLLSVKKSRTAREPHNEWEKWRGSKFAFVLLKKFKKKPWEGRASLFGGWGDLVFNQKPHLIWEGTVEWLSKDNDDGEDAANGGVKLKGRAGKKEEKR